MATTTTTKLKLKLMIDKGANKVLFAEAGKDFVDILFNLLSLNFGTVIKLLHNAKMVGCIGNLYPSLDNLNEAYLQAKQIKIQLLKPHETASVLLMPLAQPKQRKWYNCANNHRCVTEEINTLCPLCYIQMASEVRMLNMDSVTEGGIVNKLGNYMVTDDLSVTPASMISCIELLRESVKDIGDLEKKVVEVGTNEVLQLLSTSLQSDAVLTSVFLSKKETKDIGVTSEN